MGIQVIVESIDYECDHVYADGVPALEVHETIATAKVYTEKIVIEGKFRFIGAIDSKKEIVDKITALYKQE